MGTMPRLILVRHGQASLFGADYDVLSPLGEQQGAALGAYWARESFQPDRVISGPRKRHIGTWSAAQGAWPEAPDAAIDAAFDEYPATDLVARALADPATGQDPELGPLLRALQDAETGRARRFQGFFAALTARYVEGRAGWDGLETWAEFRRRVETAALTLAEHRSAGDKTVVITSGGAMAVLAGAALGIGDHGMLELAWRIRNAAIVELIWRREGAEARFGLDIFNAHPHLGRDLVSWR